jgi:hypothetical protein
MDLFYKFLILVIIFISIIVVFHLIKQRVKIYELKNGIQKIDSLNKTENFTQHNREGVSKGVREPIREPISEAISEAFSESFTNASVTSIQENNRQSLKLKNYPFNNLTSQFGIVPEAKNLKQFCIKSSCNSAYDGKEVSIDMIEYVLSRGCRFLDFEVYWGQPTIADSTNKSNTTVPVVSVSNDPTTPDTNAISLSSVLKYLEKNAFNNSMFQNAQDPLFIQLRIKYVIYLNETNNQKSLYNSIAKIITDRLSSVRFKGSVDENTNITTLARKAVVIMDTYANRDYVGVSPNLARVINMESNSDNLTHTTYEEVITQKENSYPIDANGIVTNMNVMEQVLPMTTVSRIQYLFTENYDSMSVISRYSAQFTPMLFWTNDSYLQAYEKMFNSTGTGIIMLSSAMNYADGQNVIPEIAYP